MNGTIISGFGLLDAYTVESFGNDFAYTITRKSDGENVWLQGEDASFFREVLDRTDEVYACSEYFYS